MEQKYGCHECMINNLFAYLPPKDVSLTMNFFHDHQTSRVGERKTKNCSVSHRSKHREWMQNGKIERFRDFTVCKVLEWQDAIRWLLLHVDALCYRGMTVDPTPWWCTLWPQPEVGQLRARGSTGSRPNIGYCCLIHTIMKRITDVLVVPNLCTFSSQLDIQKCFHFFF